MSKERQHPYLPKLMETFAAGRCDRREFLRSATLLGLSAGAAYAFVGRVTGESFVRPAQAAMPKGGQLRFGMSVQDLSTPHTYSWGESDITRQICEYATRTGQDNVTRPALCSAWEASDDLKTWTFTVRDGVNWHSGRPLLAEDIVWNIKHALDPATGSSMLGLMQGYMMNDDASELWDASAIEAVGDKSVVFNLKEPQLAVPEHLFHYPMHILDPEEGGTFGVGSNGTGAFELVEHELGVRCLIRAREGYWGDGPYLDEVLYVDLGDDPSAWQAAVGSGQIHGMREADVSSLETFQGMDHLVIYQVATAQTGVARFKVDQEPYTDPRVRKAVRLATDSRRALELAHQNIGIPAQHHHVCDIHPEYAALPFMERDVAAAKALLAEAGHPDGIDLGEIACKPDPAWELQAVQVMVEQWKEAGINVNINVMPSAQFWDIWDKAPFGFTEWTHRPLGVMVLALAYRSGVPWNESGYSNAEFDRLLTQAEGIADVEARREVMAQLETIMQEDGPIVQPIWRGIMTAMDKRVQGFSMHPTSYFFAEEVALEA